MVEAYGTPSAVVPAFGYFDRFSKYRDQYISTPLEEATEYKLQDFLGRRGLTVRDIRPQIQTFFDMKLKSPKDLNTFFGESIVAAFATKIPRLMGSIFSGVEIPFNEEQMKALEIAPRDFDNEMFTFGHFVSTFLAKFTILFMEAVKGGEIALPTACRECYCSEEKMNGLFMVWMRNDGRLIYPNGELINVHDANIIVRENGTMYVFTGFHHSHHQFTDITFAGEIKIENGVIKRITNRSGHYLPTSERMLNVARALRDIPGSNVGKLKTHDGLVIERAICGGMSSEVEDDLIREFNARVGFDMARKKERSTQQQCWTNMTPSPNGTVMFGRW